MTNIIVSDGARIGPGGCDLTAVTITHNPRPRVFRMLGRWRVTCPGMCPVSLGFDRWDDAVCEALRHVGHQPMPFLPDWAPPRDHGWQPLSPRYLEVGDVFPPGYDVWCSDQ